MSRGRMLLSGAYDCWAIEPKKLQSIVAFVERWRAGGPTDAAVLASLRAEREQRYEAAQSRQANQQARRTVAVIPIVGVIVNRADALSESSGAMSTQSIARDFRMALAAPEVDAIVFDVDSPGGSVFGVQELAAEIFESRGQKPIVAHCNALMASAAYWIASAADEIHVTPSGEVGSIGVIAVHEEFSKLDAELGSVTILFRGDRKADGNPHEPLSKEARESIDGRLDFYYAEFLRAVARHRGVKTSVVREKFGQGDVVGAKEAVEIGMADRVATFDESIDRVMQKRRVAAEGGFLVNTATFGDALNRAAAEMLTVPFDCGNAEHEHATCLEAQACSETKQAEQAAQLDFARRRHRRFASSR